MWKSACPPGKSIGMLSGQHATRKAKALSEFNFAKEVKDNKKRKGFLEVCQQ